MHISLQRLAELLRKVGSASEFLPNAVPSELLPYVYVLDIEGTAELPKLKVRLTGTALDRAFGRSVTGHYLESFIHGPRGGEVLNGFHLCARDKLRVWMRQIVRIRDNLPRFVEGIAFYVEPKRIYGGLVIGDLQGDVPDGSFEIKQL